MARMKVAIFDDYQTVALRMADWSPVADRADITVFTDHLHDPDDVAARLKPFDVVFVMALILAAARNLVAENLSVRTGGWQTSVGRELSGRTLGVLGLGRIGGRVARIGAAFGMSVIAWSQNLTAEAAAEAGAAYLDRDAFFAAADVVTIHLRLSDRSRGLIGAGELA